MRILIVSDTHAKMENLKTVLHKVGHIDALIHCGDVEGDEDYIRALAGCPAYLVSGNNDFFSDLPRELEIELAGRHVLISHGHYMGVSMGTERILEEADARRMQLVIFGHTHKPVIVEKDGVIAVNPGSLSYPRQEGRRPSFMLLEIDKQDRFHFTINYLGRDGEVSRNPETDN
ncbi:MAG: metallophosphoesterase family protein [Lachnospiraceae bacterium]